MSLLNDLNQFYRAWLNDSGFTIDEETGYVKSLYRSTSGFSYRTCKLDKLPIVLPNKETLNMSEDTNIIYHPLQEDSLKGESATIKLTKNQINNMLTMRMITIMMGLATALVENDGSKLSPKQRALFNKNPDFCKATLKYLKAIIGKVKQSNVGRHLLAIYLHTKSTYNDKPCKRVAVVSSTLFGDLNEGNKTIWGMANVPLKHQKAIATLIATILPELEDDGYTVASKSRIAPYFEALSNSYLALSERFDAVEKTCKSLFEDKLPYPTPTYQWVNSMDNLGKLQMAAPVLKGNSGNDVVGESTFEVDVERNVTIEENKPNTLVNASKVPVAKSAPASNAAPHPYLSGGTPAQPVSNQMAPQQNMYNQPNLQVPIQQPASGGHPYLNNGGVVNSGFNNNNSTLGF